jgi:hypothetical protein
MAAHVLASRSEESQSIVWTEDPPNFIVDIITDDVSVMSK